MTDHNAELISTGNELLSGRTLNRHGQVLGEALGRLGICLVRDTTVADEEAAIIDAVQTALLRSPIVFVSGGLGPTVDDITRDAVNRVVGGTIVMHDEARRRLEVLYRRRNRKVTDLSLRQAMVIEPGEVLLNPAGLAPGVRLDLPNDRVLFLLPGPPREFGAILDEHILPWLGAHRAVRPLPAERIWQVTGLGESDVADRLAAAGIPSGNDGVELGFCANVGRVEVRLTSRSGDAARVDAYVDRLKVELGAAVYTEGRTSLEQVVLDALNQAGATVAVAEVGTQGEVSCRLGRCGLARGVFVGGLVLPSYREVGEALQVSGELLAEEGAGSEAVAKRMAAAVRIRCGSTLGFAVSDIGGEDAASRLFLAWDDGRDAGVRALPVQGLGSMGREWACQAGLDMLWRYAVGRLGNGQSPAGRAESRM